MGCIKLPIRILKAVLLFIACVGLLCTVQSKANEKPSSSISSTPLKVGIDPKLPPYTFLDGKGSPAGFEVELIREILEQQGMAYEIYPALWSENIRKLKSGDINLHPSVMRTEERERIFDYSTVVAWFQVTLFVRQESSVKKLSDLKNGTILVERDTIWQAWATDNASHLTQILVDSSEEAITMLSAGKADAALMMFENGLYFKRKHKLKNIISVGERLFDFESRIALPEGSENLRSKINDGLIHARQNGTYDRLYGKWFVGQDSHWYSHSVVKIIGSIATLLIGILVMLSIWSRMLNHRVNEITRKYKTGQDEIKLAQTVIDTIHDMVWIKDTNNNHITVNKSAAESVGKTIEELQYSSVYEDFPDEAEGYYQDDLIVIKSKKPKLGIIERISAKDEKLWISTDKYPIFDDANTVTGILVIVTDITQQTETQNVLETREHVLSESEQLAQIGSWEHDIANNLVYFSRGTSKIVGIATEKSVLPYDESFIVVHPEDRERVFYEYNQSIKNRTKYNITHRLRLRDGSIRYVNQICKTYYDEAGAPIRSVGVVRDITELKELELKALQSQEQLAHSDRLNTMGQLSSSIAHEINQPLSSISQFCSSAKLRIEKAAINDDSLLGYLDNAIEQAQRAGEIIRRLRNLVSKQLPNMTTVNINYLIKESIALLQNTMQENQISIKMELEGDIPMILLDGVQIQQVIINLIRNSIEAMQSISNTQHEIEVETMNYDDEYIQIVVQDNGPGVSDDMVDIFFDAYVTSREDGLGLGLSICKTIIEVHEGRIWLDRDYSDGAKIIILLKKVTSK